MSVYLPETLDVTRTGVQKTISGVYMGDSEKTLQLILTKGDKPYTPPSGSRVILYTEKPDGTHGIYEFEPQNGYAFVPIAPQMVTVAGNVRCQLEIVTMNQTALYCPEFILTVARPVSDEIDAESYDDFQALEALLRKGGLRTVAELPEATAEDPIMENTIVYLADEGLYRYADDAWVQLTADEHIAAVVALQAASHTHRNKNTLDSIHAMMVNAWNTAAVCAHSHENKSILDAITSAKVADWDSAAGEGHTHANKSALDTITAAKVADWDDAATNSHTHENQSVLDNFTGNGGTLAYNGFEIPLIADDDVTLLDLQTYSGLVIRDEAITGETIQDVPFYSETSFELVEFANGYRNSIAINYAKDPQTGMPIRYIKVMMDGVEYNWYPDGWQDVDGDPIAAPSFSGFTPSSYIFGSLDGYANINNLPKEYLSLLRSMSQCINVSASAMGTIRVPDDAVERFCGEIKPHHKYFWSCDSDCTFTLPTLGSKSNWPEDDAQFVLYLNCTTDVDLTFPQGTRFVGGELPNSDAGQHKLIGCWLRGTKTWAIGGVDYEVIS